MFENFAIVTSFKPADQQGGFLFSVVTPSDMIISLGLSITAAPTLGMQVWTTGQISYDMTFSFNSNSNLSLPSKYM